MDRRDRNTVKNCDFGGKIFAADINRFACENSNFRSALWTGNNLQVTLMSIPAGCEIGAEIHQNLDQLLYIVSGCGLVMMGQNKASLNFREKISDSYAVIVPCGTWHNIVNTGNTPLKLFSVYAPPQHPFGTVHRTMEDAERSEQH